MFSTSIFTGLIKSFGGYILAFFILFGSLWKFKSNAIKKGRDEEVKKIKEETEKIKDAWSKIDNESRTFNDSLDKLRK